VKDKMAKTSASNTKLSLANVNKKAKELDAQSEVKVYSSTLDQYFTLKVDEKFKKTKVMKLVSELMSQLQYANTHEIDLQEVFIPYSILLMIKYFSSFGKEIPNDLPSQLAIMNNMINMDLLQPILESFPEDEADIIFNTINETIESVDQKYREIAERVEEIQKAFENGEIEKVIDMGDEDWFEVTLEDEEVDENEQN
jgi:hypothetical protein